MSAPPRIDPKIRFQNRWNKIRSEYKNPNRVDVVNFTQAEEDKMREQFEKRISKLKHYPYTTVRNPERFFEIDQAQALAAMTSGENPAAIRHMPVLTSSESANTWLNLPKNLERYRGFYAEEQDINDDGLRDIIVFDKYNRPFAVNGYVLSQSNLPLLEAYYKTHTTKDSRQKEDMKKWIDKNYWGITDDYKAGIAELPELDPITKETFNKWERAGYKVPKKPNKLRSIYSILCEKYFDPIFENPIGTLIQNDYGDNDMQIRKIIYKIFKNPKFNSIFYNYFIRMPLSVFVPGYQSEQNVTQRKKILEAVERVITTDDFSNCCYVYFKDISPQLKDEIDKIVPNITDENYNEMIKELKENIKTFYKTYLPPREILPLIDAETGRFPPANLAE